MKVTDGKVIEEIEGSQTSLMPNQFLQFETQNRVDSYRMERELRWNLLPI